MEAPFIGGGATPASTKKKVHFGTPGEQSDAPSDSSALYSAQQLKAAAAPNSCEHLVANELFSPGPHRETSSDSWTIEAQRSTSRMEGASSGAPLGDSSPLGGAYTPASVTWLESARKVDDLRGRLESLEQALRDMESKAAAQLERSLQEKVLATAAKIVQKRFLADKELDKKLERQIIQTAIKVVKRQNATQTMQAAVAEAAAAEAAAAEAAAAEAAAAGPAEETGTPTRKLEFDQGETSGASLAQYVTQIEQGLGEVLRRLEKKVDAVALLVDQNALELLESRLASGVQRLEGRLDALEEAALDRQQPAPVFGAAAADPSSQLLERVAAMEAAMAEQGRAVSDLLAALRTQGAAASQQAVATAATAAAAALQVAAAPVEGQAPARAAAATAAASAGEAQQDTKHAQEAQSAEPAAVAPAGPAAGQEQEQAEAAAAGQEPAAPAQQLHQRKSAAVKRSVLGDPTRSGSAAGSGVGGGSSGGTTAEAARRPQLPRLKTTHAAGTAQQIAMATARQQLARQAQRAREEAETESPVWLTMVYVFGWGLLAVLGLAAVLVGTTAALLKSGRLTEADLEFLWEKRGG